MKNGKNCFFEETNERDGAKKINVYLEHSRFSLKFSLQEEKEEEGKERDIPKNSLNNLYPLFSSTHVFL